MRDPNRIDEFLKKFGELWKSECPDWRFGQLITNLLFETGDPFYLEEDKYIEKMRTYFGKAGD